jgi:hypothetical protein
MVFEGATFKKPADFDKNLKETKQKIPGVKTRVEKILEDIKMQLILKKAA